MKTSKKSLKIRLLTTVTFLLAAIFTLIYLVFNFFFTQYIETAATSLLSEARQDYIERPFDEDKKLEPEPAAAAVTLVDEPMETDEVPYTALLSSF